MLIKEKPELATGQVIVRNLFTGNLTEITEIERDSFIDPWPEKWFEAFILSDEISWGAYINRTLVGYLLATHTRENVHIVNIAVGHEHRHNGIGRLMMKRLYEFARRGLQRCITLEVRRSNQQAISFYQRQGFKQTGVNEGYYPGGEDALYFELELRGSE